VSPPEEETNYNASGMERNSTSFIVNNSQRKRISSLEASDFYANSPSPSTSNYGGFSQRRGTPKRDEIYANKPMPGVNDGKSEVP
jgi:hypothetical protein